jgi:hypothetical protein
MQSSFVCHCARFIKSERSTHTCNRIEMHNTRTCQYSRSNPCKRQSHIRSIKIRDSNGDIRRACHRAHDRLAGVMIEVMHEERTDHDICSRWDFLAKQVDTEQIDGLADCVRILLSNF